MSVLVGHPGPWLALAEPARLARVVSAPLQAGGLYLVSYDETGDELFEMTQAELLRRLRYDTTRRHLARDEVVKLRKQEDEALAARRRALDEADPTRLYTAAQREAAGLEPKPRPPEPPSADVPATWAGELHCARDMREAYEEAPSMSLYAWLRGGR